MPQAFYHYWLCSTFRHFWFLWSTTAENAAILFTWALPASNLRIAGILFSYTAQASIQYEYAIVITGFDIVSSSVGFALVHAQGLPVYHGKSSCLSPRTFALCIRNSILDEWQSLPATEKASCRASET
ncbi:hypothetical protein K469DRAFT_366460 [Zopfia rhizophila CBS 207.26]|uniref:Uncharacterized protein n=1 Tax=Zopfia rhizophila CBS 207.26 TaxID=1314779 RepID=A0A6A6EIF8_9PEZI|nr:hypothetical protein K469DRAFT_366460 [Zopfia rhizophila CBS 207.26]